MAGSPGRIIGLETEFAIVSAHTVPMPPGTENPLSPKDAVAELYRGTPQEYLARNRFMPNGGRLYVDLGSHPEYATAECRSIHDAVAQDRAGESILRTMTERANAALLERGVQARIHVVKNNRDALGATFGCHENYQVSRSTVDQLDPGLIAFMATRPILTGGGHVRQPADGPASFRLSTRAPMIQNVTSPDPTKARPMIVTREEAHADASKFARLQVIYGDSNVSDVTTALKLGLTMAVLDYIEGGESLASLELADPIATLHELEPDSHTTLADGRHYRALDVLEAILERCEVFRTSGRVDIDQDHGIDGALVLARRAIDALRADDVSPVAGELDWLVKRALIRSFVQRQGKDWDDPLAKRVELAYHDLSTQHGLADKLRGGGIMSSYVTEADIEHAVTTPPADTRAAVRGKFAAALEDFGMQGSLGWTHVRLDSPPRPQIDLIDAFESHNPEVDDLVEEMRTSLPHFPGGRSGLGWLQLGLGAL